MKCGAETCWQEVSVDCEGPNREDREGLQYSLTYFDCLSHAVLLEPMRSLTHSEVRRAFVRCVLRSRTMPSLVRSDRGAEFKNALMAELSVMLGAEWRFSAPLRPCELGANERVHQEVQKVLGAVVRQVGSTVGDTWSDWLVVAEYVIDNTPGPHRYTPRDLERSWSLALPLARDVLRDALEFEPITEWARGQFKQFAELSAAVKAHWDRSSAARAKLANRHRRTVDLKPGDRVVWNAPKARSEGAGRVFWKPGLTGPWRVKDVRGHRLTLEPVPDVPGITFLGAIRALWRLTPRTVSSCPRTRRRLCLANPLIKTMRAEKFLAPALASRSPARLSRWSSLSRDASSSASVSAWPTVVHASLPARSVRR